MCSDEIAGQRADGHHAGFWPVDESREDEIDGGDEIDERTEDGLQRVHLVDVRQSKKSE